MGRQPSDLVVHLQLRTGNLPRACSFYTRLFGWRAEQLETVGGPYMALELGRGIDGGVVECESRPSLWLPYVAVEDLSEATSRAEALGARVLVERSEAPTGWRSLIEAPSGAEIGIWQPKG